ncbi:ABC-2 type transport system ATP-binding protein [Austwickia chelonae]|uniref:Putative ABC transporter ATP-binding protein n=1 Tax=Austwickia chelonae NBRC 105200 TaxID=1184607 RepID=K6VKE4_9MICO|nr:putative ABC transporter ATP-binding protein [Austwickia chelonae NBRC 105200]SEW04877.1 ABC-2 type transport system ATP-binding protein [Austwickia chelonae]
MIAEKLCKRFGSTVAVEGMSWSAQRGEVTVVLGSNGAGKTTTMECLEGLIRPDAGRVEVLGVDPWRASAAHRARVGVMLQDGGLPNGARPVAVLAHLARFYERPVPVEPLVRRLGIDRYARTTIRRLSGGQRRRVAFAAALVGSPEVVFLDEPTSGLDPHARLDVYEIVREHRDRGVCVVLTTHSFEEAEELADQVVVVHGGRAVARGPLRQVCGGSSLSEAYFALTGRARG